MKKPSRYYNWTSRKVKRTNIFIESKNVEMNCKWKQNYLLSSGVGESIKFLSDRPDFFYYNSTLLWSKTISKEDYLHHKIDLSQIWPDYLHRCSKCVNLPGSLLKFALIEIFMRNIRMDFYKTIIICSPEAGSKPDSTCNTNTFKWILLFLRSLKYPRFLVC